jgi:hypothetical protein
LNAGKIVSFTIHLDNQRYKILLAFAIPYLTLCAGLWHIGYWSTFDINILEHLDIADIIKSFIYPFISSVAFYFGGQIIISLIFQNSLLWQKEFKYGGAEEAIKPKRLKVIRYIIAGLTIVLLVLIFRYGGDERWIWSFFIIATYIGVALNNKGFLSEFIPERNLRLNFVFTIVLIPCMSFGFAKEKAHAIYDNHNKEATIVFIAVSQNQEPAYSNNKYKLLGVASDYIFIMTLDNKSIIMLPRIEVKQITIDKSSN